MSHLIMTVSSPVRPGIVAKISGYLAEQGCNIMDSSQFSDPISDRFLMRLTFSVQPNQTPESLNNEFAPIAAQTGIDFAFYDSAQRTKVVIMVSRFGHCLNDLLYRWRIGALPIDIVAVISNHMDYQKVVVNHDIPFHCVRVSKNNKQQAEAQLMSIVRGSGAELIVLARYMQILSDQMCREMSGKIINIHHSFLPSFKGANPYQQAYARGVKLIGATSHYVTSELDEGPIIEQDIIRVSHAQSAADYVSLGRDVESQVLARAVHAHIHHRAFLNGNKTVVFPASPDEFASERMG